LIYNREEVRARAKVRVRAMSQSECSCEEDVSREVYRKGESHIKDERKKVTTRGSHVSLMVDPPPLLVSARVAATVHGAYAGKGSGSP